MKRTLLVLACTSLLWACGEEESTEAQANEFYEDALNLSAQRECNGNDRLYATVDEECTDIPLASFDCSYAGLEAIIEGDTSTGADDIRASLDDYKDDDFEVNQCGTMESDGLTGYYIVLHFKTHNSEEARAAAAQYSFIGLGGVFAENLAEADFDSLEPVEDLDPESASDDADSEDDSTDDTPESDDS